VLSNNHVLAGINSANTGDPIIQPGDADGGSDPGDRVGTLAAYQTIDFNGGTNIMDAAIALTSTANFGTSTPADNGYGAPSAITAPAFIGQAVQKYGRTTGLQLGNVEATDVSVDVCYLLLFNTCIQQARFGGQITVSPGPFSAPGDSGSLIVTQSGNQPVALLFAGGDGLTVGSPIDPILSRFGVTIDGAPPTEGPPSAPLGLSALSGGGTVSLAWTAPSFDGGSPITNYKVYRGTSAGTETFLANAGTSTTFLDGGLTNGTTYYYKVSAENVYGESPLSSEAAATPADLVPPAMPLPTIDDFNRLNENPLSDSGRWSNGVIGSGETGLYTPSNWLACSRSTTCTAWRNSAQYGPDSESWARIATLPGTANSLRLYVRLQQPGSGAADGYELRTIQQTGTDQVLLERLDNGSLVTRLTLNQELAAGDTMLLRAKGTSIEAWRNDGSSWSRLGLVTDSTYSTGGYTGIGLRGTTGRLEDFGARTMGGAPASAPSAPQALSATPGNAQVALTWSAPSSNGGSALTTYSVYRSTTSGVLGSALSPSPGLATNYTDTTAVNGTTYYYVVKASNVVGESPGSSEMSATPTDFIPPNEPLSILDAFDRANENPLSFAGRWGNGVLGSAERSLKVLSNQCASDRSTTATAWWKTQLPADQEVYATMSTLPGNTDSFRLYTRLQAPGGSGVDGYMLLYTRLSGTDQVVIDRVTNGGFTQLVTVNRELVAGTQLLLRAKGTTLEAWVREGSAWSRIARATDSTYTGAGYVGIGIRDRIGRLDDFGAR
jgi:Fibronectin type III domain